MSKHIIYKFTIYGNLGAVRRVASHYTIYTSFYTLAAILSPHCSFSCLSRLLDSTVLLVHPEGLLQLQAADRAGVRCPVGIQVAAAAARALHNGRCRRSDEALKFNTSL